REREREREGERERGRERIEAESKRSPNALKSVKSKKTASKCQVVQGRRVIWLLIACLHEINLNAKERERARKREGENKAPSKQQPWGYLQHSDSHAAEGIK